MITLAFLAGLAVGIGVMLPPFFRLLGKYHEARTRVFQLISDRNDYCRTAQKLLAQSNRMQATINQLRFGALPTTIARGVVADDDWPKWLDVGLEAE